MGLGLARYQDDRTKGSEVLAAFENEVFLMRELQHANLVRFFGAQMKPPSLCIVMELMKGSLADLLYGKLSKGVEQTLAPDSARTLSVLQGIAGGMGFLHEHSVIHRDLKSANVLFNRQLQVKLCDFAFSKFKLAAGENSWGGAASSAAFESTVGTPAWMAPEVLRGDEYTMRADVYSFGVLVWETMARRQPWRELNGFQIINAVGMEGRCLSFSNAEGSGETGAPLLWRRVAASCWERNPKRRPTFAQLDGVCRAATQQLAEGTAKLLASAQEPTAAQASAGMDAWRKVTADIEVSASAAAAAAVVANRHVDPASPRVAATVGDAAAGDASAVYTSGLIADLRSSTGDLSAVKEGDHEGEDIGESSSSGGGSSVGGSSGGGSSGRTPAPAQAQAQAQAQQAQAQAQAPSTGSSRKSDSKPPAAGSEDDDDDETDSDNGDML